MSRKNLRKSSDSAPAIPVAMRRISEDRSSSWVSVMAEETPKLQKKIEFKTLHEKQSIIEWNNVVHKFFAITDTTLWKVFMVLLIFFNYLYSSYAFFFIRVDIKMSTHYIILTMDSIYAFDYICAIVVYSWKKLQLRMTYRPRSKYTLIFDAFLVIPYSEIYTFVHPDADTILVYLLRFITFFRLFHLPRFFKTKSAGANHWKYFLMEFFTYLVLLIHTVALVLNLRAIPLRTKNVDTRRWFRTVTIFTFITEYKYYLVCVYFAVLCITNCGIGDVRSQTLNTAAYASVAMCLGLVLSTGYFTGTLTSLFVNSSERKALLRNQVMSIRNHLTHLNMSRKEIRMIMVYYEMLWVKKKGIREAADFHLLPLPLRMEISYDVNICLLQCSMLFKNKPEPFLRTLSLLMKHEFYQTGDLVYTQNSVKNKMIFVASGVVEILSEEDDQSPIVSFGAGTCLGEASLILSLTARASLRVSKYTELQVLYRKNFFRMIELYPEIYVDISTEIKNRIEICKRSKERMGEHRQLQHRLNIFASQHHRDSAIKKLKMRMNPATAFNVNLRENFYYGALPLYRFSENVKKAKKRFLCLSENFPWILQPNTTLTWSWEIVIVINAVLIGIIYPHYISFYKSFPKWFIKVSYGLELINVLDLYVIITTAVIKKDRMLTTVKDILSFRLNTLGFYMDLFATFYLEVFTYMFNINDSYFYYLFKINRLLKLYRVCKFFDHLEENLDVNIVTIRLIKYPTYLIYIPYLFGSALYLETCYSPSCVQSGWFRKKANLEQRLGLKNKLTDHPIYISVYYALVLMSAVGYGDLRIGNTVDLMVVCIGIIIGFLVFGYCIAEFSAIFTHNLKLKTDFQEALYSLNKFMQDKKMDQRIKKRIQDFFLLQWYYNKGLGIISKSSLFYNAPEKIEQLVLMKERMETLARVPLFRYTEPDFVQLFVSGSRLVILPPNEVVHYVGGITRELYVIQKGYCRMESGTEKNVSRILGPGMDFGFPSFVYGVSSFTKVTTITHVQLITMDSMLLNHALSVFPAIRQELRDLDQEYEFSSTARELATEAIKRDEQKNRTQHEETNAKAKEKIPSFVNVLKYCRERGEDYSEPFGQLGQMFWVKYLLLPICIVPNGLFIKVWASFRTTAAFVMCLLVLFAVTEMPYATILTNAVYFMDVIAYIDIYLMLFVGFYGKNNQLVIHPLMTAKHYIKGMFVIDVLLCFPWNRSSSLVLPSLDDSIEKSQRSMVPHLYHYILRIVKVFQVYRLPRAFQYLENDIRNKGEILEILKFMPLSLILVYFCASIIVVTSCRYYKISDLANVIPKPHGYDKVVNEKYAMLCQEDCWIDSSRYANFSSPYHIFVVAMYLSTSTLVGTGFGDVTPMDILQMIVIMVMIVCGVLFFCYSLASISSHKAVEHSTLSHYQEMLSELKSFMVMEHLSSQKQKSLIDHIKYKWKRTGGSEPNEILRNLHTALHEDAALCIYEKTLREVSLFKHVDRSFFRVIGKMIRERYFQKNECVIRAEDVVEYMFIIHRGQVAVMSAGNEVINRMGVGGIFGNITPQSKAKIAVTILSEKNLDLLYIKTDMFYKVLKAYPSVKRKIDYVVATSYDDYVMPTFRIVDEDKSRTSLRSSRKVASRISTHSDFSADVEPEPGNVTDLLKPQKWFKVAFLPSSKIYKVYDAISMVAAYVNCVLVTYQFAFQHHNVALLSIAVVLDVIFLLKMFLEVHKAHLDRYGNYITNNEKLRRIYWRNRKDRIIDLLANLPIHYSAFLFRFVASVDSYFLFSLFRMTTLLRYNYVMEFYKIQSNKLEVNRFYLKISAIGMWIILMSHLFACIFYLMACPLTYCKTNTWLALFFENNTYAARTNWNCYILSLYFIINILTTTGTGDIVVANISELLMIATLMLTAKFSIGIFIGDVTAVLTVCTSYMVNYEYGIQELKDYMSNENVSEHQIRRMWNYVQQLWMRNHGKQIPRLIQMLPQVRRTDIMFDVYGRHVTNSYLFCDTEEAFKRQLCLHLKHFFFFPGDYIVQSGDSDQSMYFIHRGEVEILTIQSNLAETFHDVLLQGQMFGMVQGLFLGVPHHFSFRAKTTVNIVSLQFNRWNHLLKFFPKSKEFIYDRAESIFAKM